MNLLIKFMLQADRIQMFTCGPRLLFEKIQEEFFKAFLTLDQKNVQYVPSSFWQLPQSS